jgi:hypothetical protein
LCEFPADASGVKDTPAGRGLGRGREHKRIRDRLATCLALKTWLWLECESAFFRLFLEYHSAGFDGICAGGANSFMILDAGFGAPRP